MQPHHTKDDRLCNLNPAVKELRQEIVRQRNRDTVIKEFDSKPLFERQSLYCTYKGNKKAHLCFINDYAKLSIMGYFK